MTTASGPAAKEPAHLFIASDDETTVVSVLRPDTAGRTDPDTVGPVTFVNVGPIERRDPNGVVVREPARVWSHAPKSGNAGWHSICLAAVTAITAGTTGHPAVIPLGVASIGATIAWDWRQYRRVRAQWQDGHLFLTHHDDIEAIYAAASAARGVAALWPRLRAFIELDDPSRALARHLWLLTVLLTERAANRASRDALAAAVAHVSPEGEAAAQIGIRLREAEDTLSRIDAAVEERLGHLRRLADETSAFVTAQEALASARAALREFGHSTSVSATTADMDGDIGELAEHTTAVLAAFRELTRQ